MEREERHYQQVLQRHRRHRVVGHRTDSQLSAAARADGRVLYVEIGHLGQEIFNLRIKLAAEANRVADITKIARFLSHLRGGQIVTRASGVAVTIHLSVAISLQNIYGRVSVGISPNSKVFTSQCPIQRVILSILHSRKILLVRIYPKCDLP